jgi:biopolymer transport protein ExbD/translation initiation factor IF-3
MAKREIPEINAGSMADIAFLLLIFFLVTTTMEKDTAYVRKIPKKVELPQTDPIEKRNICDIAANNKNQLLFRGVAMDDPDLISDKVLEFYQMNENLTKAQTIAALKNPGYKGSNFPFYSFTSKEEIEENILKSEIQLAEVENTPGVEQDMIEFKLKQLDEWLAKQKAAESYGKNILPEIHFQAHIRVEVMAETEYELFAKIQSEVEQAIYELRDIAAKDIFGESYGIIKQREAMDKTDKAGDKRKLKLLEVLYPARIIEVKPN